MPKPIGNLIRQLRESRGLNKAELARRSGVSAPYITQIEADQRTPSDAVLRQLAGALGIENYRLLEPAGYRFEGEGYFENYERAIESLQDYLGESDYGYYLEGILKELPSLARWMASGPALPAGPIGWDELNADDQRLVQKIINRLRPESADGELEPEPTDD